MFLFHCNIDAALLIFYVSWVLLCSWVLSILHTINLFSFGLSFGFSHYMLVEITFWKSSFLKVAFFISSVCCMIIRRGEWSEGEIVIACEMRIWCYLEERILACVVGWVEYNFMYDSNLCFMKLVLIWILTRFWGLKNKVICHRTTTYHLSEIFHKKLLFYSYVF